MKTKKVSVIIPVYNVERYLEACLKSVKKQTYKNLEVILSDDGSSDASSGICDRFAEEDSRFMVIHQQNKGAASARNHALDQMSGEYACFVDSDDYVDPDYIKALVTALETQQADLAVCQFSEVFKDHTRPHPLGFQKSTYSQKQFLELFLTDWESGLIWNKLFKAELLQGIRFPEGHKIDDEFFTYQTVMKAKQIVCIEPYLYFYRMRKSSVMNASSAYRENILLDQMEYMTERFEKVTEAFPDLRIAYLENLADNLTAFRKKSIGYPFAEQMRKKAVRHYFLNIISASLKRETKHAFLRSVFCGPSEAVQEYGNQENRDQLFD